MRQESIIADELRARIGVEKGPYLINVEVGDLRRFSEAVRHCGEGGAAVEGVVPPTLFCPDPIIAADLCGLERPRPWKYSIDGGSEWQFHRSVRAGDTLRLYSRIVDLYEKHGSAKTGRMLFTIIEVRCIDQEGELVGTGRSTAIAYEGGENREEAA